MTSLLQIPVHPVSPGITDGKGLTGCSPDGGCRGRKLINAITTMRWSPPPLLAALFIHGRGSHIGYEPILCRAVHGQSTAGTIDDGGGLLILQ
jgi:hypothetical protein